MTSDAISCCYSPGTATALVAPYAALLVDLTIDHPLVVELWFALEGTTPAERVMGLLGTAETSTAYALISRGDSGWRLVLRNGFTARLQDQVLRSQPGTAFDIALAEISGEWQLGTMSSLEHETSVLALPIGAGIVTAGVITSALPVTGNIERPSSVPDAPIDVRVAAPQPTEEPPRADEDSDRGGSNYSALFGSSLDRDAFLSLITEQAEAAQADDTPGPDAAPPTPDPPATAVEQKVATAVWSDILGAAESGRSEPPTGLIDSFPWMSDSTEPNPPTPSSTAQGPTPPSSAAQEEVSAPPSALEVADNARTMTRAELRSLLAQSHDRDPIAGPSVLAAFCANGHPNPHYNDTCRVCGSEVTAEEPQRIARPVLGGLTLPNGDVVPLDREVILGRSPSTSDIPAAEKPNLVRLSDPGISRNHAHILIDGWQVLVRDLGSSNGTEIIAPGEEPLTLRAQQDYPLEAGSVVRLAGELDLRFEVDS